MDSAPTPKRRLTNYDDKRSLGSRLRARRLAPLLALIDTVHRQQGSVRLLDMGGEPNYWNILPDGYLDSRQVVITLVNLPGTFTEKAKASVDANRFRFIDGDACNLADWQDGAFDIVHSNSVIEHVGDWSRRVAFAREALRLAPHCFVQTPNFWFPVEPHYMTPFIHWLPKPTQVWWLMQMRLGHMAKAKTVDEAVLTIESIHLLNHKMMVALFPGTRIWTERVLGLPKSFVAIR